MPQKPKFTDLNPFKDCPKASLVRFVSNVDRATYNFFYAVNPVPGQQQTTINLLFSKLHAKCLELGIVPGPADSPERYTTLITTFQFELPRSSSDGVVRITNAPNDGGPTPGNSSKDETTKDGSSIVPGAVGKRKPASKRSKAVKGK